MKLSKVFVRFSLRPLRASWRLLVCQMGLMAITVVPAHAQTRRIVIQLPGFGAPIFLDTLGTWQDVFANADDVYRTLAGVYSALMIPDNLRDSVGRYVGNTAFRKSRSLAGGPMSRLVECGAGMTGPNADSYRINLAIVTRVEPVGEGKARLRSALVASGEDISGPSKELVACGSTGALEAKIHALVIQRLSVR